MRQGRFGRTAATGVAAGLSAAVAGGTNASAALTIVPPAVQYVVLNGNAYVGPAGGAGGPEGGGGGGGARSPSTVDSLW